MGDSDVKQGKLVSQCSFYLLLTVELPWKLWFMFDQKIFGPLYLFHSVGGCAAGVKRVVFEVNFSLHIMSPSNFCHSKSWYKQALMHMHTWC